MRSLSNPLLSSLVVYRVTNVKHDHEILTLNIKTTHNYTDAINLIINIDRYTVYKDMYICPPLYVKALSIDSWNVKKEELATPEALLFDMLYIDRTTCTKVGHSAQTLDIFLPC